VAAPYHLICGRIVAPAPQPFGARESARARVGGQGCAVRPSPVGHPWGLVPRSWAAPRFRHMVF